MALTGAPLFPTQNQEGTVGGYDVQLPRPGIPVFLQFKRSDYMKTRRAAEAEELGTPYYRFHLRPRRHSDQHSLLLALEKDGNEVFYVALRFHTVDELNDAYQSNQVAERSTFVAPTELGEIDDEEDHYVAVAADNQQWRLCSRTPRRIQTVDTRDVLRERVKAREKSRGIDNRFWLELGDRMVSNYFGRDPASRELDRAKAVAVRRERRPAEYVREMAHMLYGCELLISLVD